MRKNGTAGPSSNGRDCGMAGEASQPPASAADAHSQAHAHGLRVATYGEPGHCPAAYGGAMPSFISPAPSLQPGDPLLTPALPEPLRLSSGHLAPVQTGLPGLGTFGGLGSLHGSGMLPGFLAAAGGAPGLGMLTASGRLEDALRLHGSGRLSGGGLVLAAPGLQRSSSGGAHGCAATSTEPSLEHRTFGLRQRGEGAPSGQAAVTSRVMGRAQRPRSPQDGDFDSDDCDMEDQEEWDSDAEDEGEASGRKGRGKAKGRQAGKAHGKGKGQRPVGRPRLFNGDPDDPRLSEAERRRIKRRIANRDSAARVRQRKLDEVKTLEKTVRAGRARNNALQESLAREAASAEALRGRVQSLHASLAASQAEIARLQQQLAHARVRPPSAEPASAGFQQLPRPFSQPPAVNRGSTSPGSAGGAQQPATPSPFMRAQPAAPADVGLPIPQLTGLQGLNGTPLASPSGTPNGGAAGAPNGAASGAAHGAAAGGADSGHSGDSGEPRQQR